MLMNGQGQCVLLDVNEQYEFALPSMVTSGIVVLEGMIYEVDGISWLDRQWGGLPRFFADPFTIGVDGFSSMNWIRSNAQLDNGVNIALAQVRDMHDHKIYLALTAVHPDGTHIVVPAIDPVEAGDYWTSPVTGRRYPTRCVFRATQIHTELIVEVPFKEQEIVSSVSAAFTKFQGAATITGTYQGLEVFGRGYLELVGNWSCPPQPPIATRLAG
jgi:predicted secreted hydrolase